MFKVRPEPAANVRETWAGYLDEVLGEGFDSLQGADRLQCLEGVAAFCADYSLGIEDATLRPMLRRALEASFGTDTADDWLRCQEGNPQLPPEISPELKDMRLARILSSLDSAEGTVRWKLKLLAETRKLRSGLEMLWFARVRRRLEQIAVLWDVSSGRGEVRLCGIMRAARVIENENPSATVAFCTETLAYARDIMREQARRRKWKEIPAVESGDVF